MAEQNPDREEEKVAKGKPSPLALGLTVPFSRGGVVGVDIGSSSLKVVELQEGPAGMEIVRAGIRETPREEEGKDREAILARALSDLLTTTGIEGKKAVTVFRGTSLTARNIVLPAMSEEELEKGLGLQAREYLSYPPEEAVLDSAPVGEIVEGESRQMEVTLVAARRDAVLASLSVIRQAGMRPVAVGVVPFALLRFFSENELTDPKELVAFIDIGATHTSINIFQGTSVGFTRDIALGGNALTEAIAGRLEKSFAEAEAKKKEQARARGRQEVLPPGEEADLSLAIQPVMDRMVDQINRSFDYYRAQARGGRVSRVFLSGGMARLTGIAEFLSEGLGLPVRVVNPLEEMRVREEATVVLPSEGPSLAVAAGLALGGTDPRINLLPREMRPKSLAAVLKENALKLAGAGLAILLLGNFLLLRGKEQSYHKQLERLGREEAKWRQDLEGIDAQVEAWDELKRKRTHFEEKVTFLREREGERLLVVRLLKDLSEIVPGELHLNRLVVGNRDVFAAGQATKAADVAELCQDVEDLPYVEKVVRCPMRTVGDVVHFELKYRLKEGIPPDSE